MKKSTFAKIFTVTAISALLSTTAIAAEKSFTISYDVDIPSIDDLQKVIDEFNSKNKTSLKLVKYEKDAPATLNLFVDAKFGKDNDILLNSKKFISVSKMADLAKTKIDTAKLAKNPTLKVAELNDKKGKIIAFPLYVNTTMMFYDKNAFRRADLDENKAPTTWIELQDVLGKLAKKGISCPYTSSVPVAVHLDNISALAGQNSVKSFNDLTQIRHIAMMTTWYQAKFFKTFGKDYQASEKFLDGTCAIITTDSWEYKRFADAKGSNLGVAKLPKHEEDRATNSYTLTNGGYIWAGAGYSNENYKNAVKFLNFLTEKDSQKYLLKQNFAVPLNSNVSLDSDEKAFLKLVEESINAKKSNAENNYSSLRSYGEIEEIAYDALLNIWSGKKTVKSGLDEAEKQTETLMNKKANLKKNPF